MILSAKFRGSRCRCHSLSCLWFFPYHCPSKSSKVDGAKKNRSQIASFKKKLLSNLLNINQMLKRGQVSSLMQLQPSYVWSLDWFLLLLDQLQLHETQKILYNSISCLHLPKSHCPSVLVFFSPNFATFPICRKASMAPSKPHQQQVHLATFCTSQVGAAMGLVVSYQGVWLYHLVIGNISLPIICECPYIIIHCMLYIYIWCSVAHPPPLWMGHGPPPPVVVGLVSDAADFLWFLVPPPPMVPPPCGVGNGGVVVVVVVVVVEVVVVVVIW